MPAGHPTNTQELLGNVQKLLEMLNSLAPVVSTVPLPAGTPTMADALAVAQVINGAANALAQENAATKTQLQTCESAYAALKSSAPVSGGNAGATAPPANDAQTQVYVSAPAAGAIALIAALAGGGIGYAVKGHLDKKRKSGAKELAAKEAKRLRAGEEEEEE
jgi:hypothetical protein